MTNGPNHQPKRESQRATLAPFEHLDFPHWNLTGHWSLIIGNSARWHQSPRLPNAGSLMSNAPIVVNIQRQDRPDSAPYWQTFSIPYKPNMNVTSVLQAIAANPVTADGQKVAPLNYDWPASRKSAAPAPWSSTATPARPVPPSSTRSAASTATAPSPSSPCPSSPSSATSSSTALACLITSYASRAGSRQRLLRPRPRPRHRRPPRTLSTLFPAA